MEKSELNRMVNNLLDEFVSSLPSCIDRGVESGVIELSEFENNYILPKMVFSAILKQASEDYKPSGRNREYKNICVMV